MNEQHQQPNPSDHPADSAPAAPKAPEKAPVPKEHVEPNRIVAALSYLGVLFLIPLLLEKDDEFVKFHLRQGIALFAVGVIASFAFHYQRGGSLLSVVLVVISIVAAVRAWSGERWVLPVIGKYAAKISL